MALLIDSSLNLNSGMVAYQSYIRLEYSVSRFGKSIKCEIYPYLTKDEYIKDKNAGGSLTYPNIIDVKDLLCYQEFGYDKLSEGDDVLQIVHDKVKTYLTTDLTMEIKTLDPSTGEPVYNTIIVREKFALPENVSIVDISTG
jgi:hypothetical protein